MEFLEYGDADADIILIQPVDAHDLSLMEQEIAAIRENTAEDFRLIACKADDWNRDLSPWKAPAVFGKEEFGDGAAQTLQEILKYCDGCRDRRKTYYIGGYSLAGLFALWAVCQTDLFRGAAAASPSLWFPGFEEFMKERKIKSGTVYLSLGDKEEKTRNPVMATVGDRIRGAEILLKEQGINCILEWNPGNHFKDADQRTAKAFAWVMKQPLE
ncbi:hypothetical protein CXIVA_04580 [Clostridium sp. SY8519]|uniref:esterase n=1 Tax=Clostridium sp. (strain SY8519) TaxID=1042156 RepID=UPI0002171B21|nr:esterase [Clostridium sp. SY8519]BAK46425.1 hypothetical protein CXIVA_04580 [Clostridium sp. SY8519]